MRKFLAAFLIIAVFMLSGCGASAQNDSGNTNISSEPTVQAEITNTPAAITKTEQQTPAPTSKADSGKTTGNTKPSVSASPAAKKSETFTLLVTQDKKSKEIINKKIEISSKKSLMDFLKKEASVIEDGGFVKSINDISSIASSKLTAEQKKAGVLGVDWFIYVNGKKTSVGAYDVYPKSNDIVNLDYREWTYQDYGP